MPNNAVVGHTGRIPPGNGNGSPARYNPFAAAAATPQSGDEPATAPQIAHFFALYARDG